MDQASPPPPPPQTGSTLDNGKRRRMSQVDEVNILDSTTRKRKRVSAAGNADGNYDPGEGRAGSPSSGSAGALLASQPARTAEEFQQVQAKATILYDKLMTQRDPHQYDRYLHQHFLELPDQTIIPEYYEKIKKPVCLNQIKQRIDQSLYTSLLEAKTDMNQIFVNAKRFNAPGSPLFMDAKKLHKNLRANYAYLIGEAPPPEEDEPPQQSNNRRNRRASSSVAPGFGAAGGGGGEDGDYVDSGGNLSTGGAGGGNKRGPTLKPWLLKKFDQLVRKTDPSGRFYSDVFKVLPDKKAWPEYYKWIHNPISLDQIVSKTTARKYRSVSEFKKDVENCFANAMYFNEEGSVIWNDAKTMLDHFNEIMKEQPPKFAPPRKYNTARRRAEIEQAKANGTYYEDQDGDGDQDQDQDPGREDDGGITGEDGEGENGAGESDDGGDDDSDNGGGGGGDYSTGFLDSTTEAILNGLSNPFGAATTTDSIPVFDSNNTPLDALTSLANLASSLSPQRPPALALPSQPNSFNGAPIPSTSFSQPLAQTSAASASASASTRLGSATVGAFSPKPLAKIPASDELPLISSFSISFETPSSAPKIILDNSQSRQHSFTVPPSTKKVELQASYRQHASDNLRIETSNRRIEISAVNEDSATGNPSNWTLLPKRGLNTIEFTVKPLTVVSGVDEVYRIFIAK